MSYLHRNGIVHADLKGVRGWFIVQSQQLSIHILAQDNILVSADGKPKINDFGISRIVVNSRTIADSTRVRGNTRWMEPELLSVNLNVLVSEHPSHTKATDVWAFGMVVYVR